MTPDPRDPRVHFGGCYTEHHDCALRLLDASLHDLDAARERNAELERMLRRIDDVTIWEIGQTAINRGIQEEIEALLGIALKETDQ